MNIQLLLYTHLKVAMVVLHMRYTPQWDYMPSPKENGDVHIVCSGLKTLEA